jgi:hypothetical protein
MNDVDTSKLEAALKAAEIRGDDLLQIEGAGAFALVNGMRMRVAVDTAATKNSIAPHIEEATETRVTDEVGPETLYAPNIEYGVKTKPNYPIQPFVRPTTVEDFGKVVNGMEAAFGMTLQRKVTT